jgi:hypothetical protein
LGDSKRNSIRLIWAPVFSAVLRPAECETGFASTHDSIKCGQVTDSAKGAHEVKIFDLISSLIGVEDQRPAVAAEATAEDHQEFVTYLRQKYRPFRKAGMTIEDEFKAWVADRASKRAGVPGAAATGAPAAPAEPLD